jgi:hypothetical protein
MKLLLLFCLLPLLSLGQLKWSFDNTLTGVYGTTKTGNQLTLTLGGINSLDYKKFGFDYNPSYIIQYSPQLTNNEYLSRQNIRYNNSKFDAFVTHTYNYSFIRGIDNDNFIGIGGGIKKEQKDKFKISVSYAVLYQKTVFANGIEKDYFRHSLRTRIKWTTEKIQFISEVYFQPSMTDFNNQIINASNQLVLFPKNKVNLTIQDLINYRSDSETRMIHKLTVGIKVKISKS